MMIEFQDISVLLVDIMGIIAMEGYHAGTVREMLIVQSHAQTRYGMPVYQLTQARRQESPCAAAGPKCKRSWGSCNADSDCLLTCKDWSIS